MAFGKHEPTVREAVGIFHNADSLRGAIEDLMASGFKFEEIGLLASEQVVEQSLGDLYVRTNEAGNTPDSPAIAFVRRESYGEARTHTGGLAFVGATGAAGAVVASTALLGSALLPAVGAVVGVGLIGAFVASFIHQSDAEYLQQQIDEGHMLLFVRVDPEREAEAMNILKRQSGLDVKIYEVPVRAPAVPNAPRLGDEVRSTP